MQETENQLTQTSMLKTNEPEISDNSSDIIEKQGESCLEEGQSRDPSELKILGKFKSVEDLSKAYTELQKQQGEKSQELGKLRKEASSVENLTKSLQETVELQNYMKEYLTEYRVKYDTPEYFQDSSFKDIYKEAFWALGQNLDTDKFISLLENYVTSRISLYEKTNAAKKETEAALNQMEYCPDEKTKFAPVKKNFDEMNDKEIDELLERLI